MFNSVIQLTFFSKDFLRNQHERRFLFDISLATSFVLFAFCAIVSSEQYFGKPIDCIMNEKGVLSSSENDQNVINTFCYISAKHTAVKFDGHGVDTSVEKKYSFYPWIPLILLLQALSFLLPHGFWAYVDNGFFEKCLRDRDALLVDIVQIKMLAKYLVNRMSTLGLWSFAYVLSEYIYMIIVVMNLCLTDFFLGGYILRYGVEVFNNTSLAENSFAENTFFPTMTKCSFIKYGPSGSLEKRDALCVMTLNMLNEKFYLFLWFWFILLLATSAFTLLQHLIFLITFILKKKCLFMVRILLASNIDYKGVFLLMNKLTLGDWIFIQQIKRSMFVSSYTLLLKDMVSEMSDTYKPISNSNVVHQVDSFEVEEDSNSNF